MENTVRISQTAIDNCLGEIQVSLMKKCGFKAARIRILPLLRYVNTGRASVDFLRCLLSTDPQKVARAIDKGGSDEEVIQRVKKRINYDEGNF